MNEANSERADAKQKILSSKNNAVATSDQETILECEKTWIYVLLIAVGGYLGAFTYSLRGGVFCNAQTANVVLFAMALGNGRWSKAVYYLIPIGAYLLGAIVSEWMPNPLKRRQLLRWDTILVGVEALVMIALGFLPDSAPFQISQVTINFICSMQYNTFRQAERVPMATTFCTNHIRQTGVFWVQWMRHKDDVQKRRRCLTHLLMLFSFLAGGVVSTVCCRFLGGKTIWLAAIPLLVIFVDLVYADLKKEKDLRALKPHGH